MTSSLVGSEMCIRDRSGTPRRKPALQVSGTLSISPDNHICMRPESEPVSYTHLTLPTICSV
eukprot:6047241-Prorocentrum_lima.AAC.1